MPSLMASLGLDASDFNRKAEQVVAKTNQVAQKVRTAAIGPRVVDSSVHATRASQKVLDDFEKNRTRVMTAGSLATTGVANTQEKASRSRAESIRREAAEARRLDLIQRDHARAWHAQERTQMAMFRAAEAEKSKVRKRASEEARFQLDADRARAEGLRKTTGVSALGGAAKMFGAFLTFDFLKNQTQKTIQYASEIGKLSGRLNVSTTDLQAWDAVLKQNGSSLQQVAPVLDRFNKSRILALQGSEKQKAAASLLGLNEDEMRTMSTTDLMMKAGQALESGENREAVLAALQTMGGDGAMAFVEAFQNGMPAAVQAVKDAGELMSQTTIASLKNIGDRWSAMFQSLFSGFGGLIEPILSHITDKFEGLMFAFKSVSSVAAPLWDMFTTGKEGVDAFLKGDKEGAKKAFEQLHNPFPEMWDGMKNAAKSKFETDQKRKQILKEAEKPFEAKLVDLEVENKKEKLRQDKEEKALEKEAMREQERELKENAKLGAHKVSSFQQMGGFLGNFALAAGPEVAAMNAQVNSERHLRELVEIIKKKKNNPLTSAESDVEF